jgi:hypothetical protein
VSAFGWAEKSGWVMLPVGPFAAAADFMRQWLFLGCESFLHFCSLPSKLAYQPQ